MSAFKAAREWMASSTLAHVAFGFFAMGAWAWFANREHPIEQAFLAALVQGTISGTLTLVLKKALEWMSAVMDRRRPRRPAPAHAGEDAGGPYLSLILPPLITASSILAILTAAHTLAGTPEIASTIAVPFTVSTTYAILYNLKLWRAAHGRR